MDSVTDGKLQQTIREEFRDCTVLTIAHRLETIADYDLVVVMDQGRVAEVGSPLELLQATPATDQSTDSFHTAHKGIFRGLVDGLGEERRQEFLNIARKRAETSSIHREENKY